MAIITTSGVLDCFVQQFAQQFAAESAANESALVYQTPGIMKIWKLCELCGNGYYDGLFGPHSCPAPFPFASLPVPPPPPAPPPPPEREPLCTRCRAQRGQHRCITFYEGVSQVAETSMAEHGKDCNCKPCTWSSQQRGVASDIPAARPARSPASPQLAASMLGVWRLR